MDDKKENEDKDKEQSWDSKIGYEDKMEVDYNSEVETLRRELTELRNVVKGAFQIASKDSNKSAKPSGTPKKKKTSEGIR